MPRSCPGLRSSLGVTVPLAEAFADWTAIVPALTQRPRCALVSSLCPYPPQTRKEHRTGCVNHTSARRLEKSLLTGWIAMLTQGIGGNHNSTAENSMFFGHMTIIFSA